MKTTLKTKKENTGSSKLVKKAVALTVASTMTFSALSLTAFAALPDEQPAKNYSKMTDVKYATNDAGVRTGLRSVTIDGITYYDMNNGVKDEKLATDKDTLYRAALTRNVPNYTDNWGTTPIDYWSQLAYLIYRNNWEYSGNDFTSEKDFDNYQSKATNGRPDIVNDLKSINGSTRTGSKGIGYGDNTWVSGLTTANSLYDVRQKMAQSIADGIGWPKCIDANDVFKHTDGDNTLKQLNDTTQRDVLYTMVTSIDKSSANMYNYNSYGLAFYDFKLQVVNDPDLDLVTATEGYDSIEEAAENKVPDVVYNETNITNSDLEYVYNYKSDPVTQKTNYQSTFDETVSNTVSNSQTYSFGQTLSGTSRWGMPTRFWGGSVSVNFSANEAYTQTESISNSKHNGGNIGSTLIVPQAPHTASPIKVSDGTIVESTTYQCPVAITYKVAIFGLSGEVYCGGSGSSTHWNTAGYERAYFCTVFGEKTGTAMGDLKDRIDHKNSNGYESSQGCTRGWTSDGKKFVYELKWDEFLGKTPKSSGYSGLQTGYTVTNWLMSNSPMSSFGATIQRDMKTHIYEAMTGVALYPLTETGYEGSNSAIKDLNVTTGQTLNINIYDLGLKGYDDVTNEGKKVEYYGFDAKKGDWILTDANGNKIDSSDVATLSYNKVTGDMKIEAKKAGDVYFKYLIDENVYKAKDQKEFAKNSDLNKKAMLHVKVTDEAYDVKVSGSVTGNVGDVIDLNSSSSGVTVKVYKDDVQIAVDPSEITWQQQDLGIVSIDNNNQMTLKEEGTNQIRAWYKGNHSDWVPVTVKAATPVTPDPEKIQTININVTAPKTGETPDLRATTSEVGYTCKDVAWNPNDNPFEGGVKYTANITLTANEGYTFSDNMQVTVNGNTAKVLSGNKTPTTVTLAYTFSATEVISALDPDEETDNGIFYSPDTIIIV